MAKFVLHHVGRVLRPAEAGLHEREPGLHEDHQHRADDDPQEVQPERRLVRVSGHLGAATGRRIDPGSERVRRRQDDHRHGGHEDADCSPFREPHTHPS